MTPETRAAVHAAADALRRQGFRVEPFRPASLEPARKLWHTLFVQCGAMLLEPESQQDLSPTFLNFLEIAHALSPLTAQSLLQTWAEIDLLRARFLAEMRAFPILLCPACAIPAFRHGERQWLIDGQQVDYLDAMRYTQWFNLLGAPAAVLPIARSARNLPIAVQIAGRPWHDEHVLTVAAALHTAFPFAAPPSQLD